MNRLWKPSSAWCAAWLAVVLTPGGVAFGQPPAPPPPTKKVIELPTKKLVAGATPAGPAATTPAVNPPVAPGKVKWHKSFADACAAAQQSGKPVFLFQMLGRLDQEFT